MEINVAKKILSNKLKNETDKDLIKYYQDGIKTLDSIDLLRKSPETILNTKSLVNLADEFDTEYSHLFKFDTLNVPHSDKNYSETKNLIKYYQKHGAESDLENYLNLQNKNDDLNQFLENLSRESRIARQSQQKENEQKYLKNKKPKANLSDFIIKHIPLEKDVGTASNPSPVSGLFELYTKDGQKIGNFPYNPSYLDTIDSANLVGKSHVKLPEYITMGFPRLDPDYRGMGLGEQMYQHIEKELNKTIFPDTMLSQYSLPLHQKKGLGNLFGSSNYQPVILSNVEKQINQSIDQGLLPEMSKEQIAKKAKSVYKKIKDKFVKEVGLENFKSVLPYLVKGAVAGGSAGLSLGVEAAEKASETEKLGPQPITSDYWLEKLYKNPEEQEQRAKTSKARESFLQSTEPAYPTLDTDLNYWTQDQEEIERTKKKLDYEKSVLSAQLAGTLKPNYVEKNNESNDDFQFKLPDYMAKLNALQRIKGNR